MRLNGILFDKDGTLFDFQKSWGNWTKNFIGLMSRDGDETQALAEALMFDLTAACFHPASPIIAGTLEEIVVAIGGIRSDISHAELRSFVITESTEAEQVPAADLHQVLGGLRQMGVAIGLSTNDAEEPARANLAAHSILEYFDFIAGYDSGYGAKPGTGMQEAFLAQARLEASDVAMVGDSLHDLISGRDAGMRTIAVLSGPATEAELLPFADIVLPDIGHIPDLMKR